MNRHRVKLLTISLILLTVATASWAALSPARWTQLGEEERYYLTRAENVFQKEDYPTAKSEYDHFLQLFPKSSGAPYALLMTAECTRLSGKVNEAIKEFQSVQDYFPSAPDVADARCAIGYCYVLTGDTEKAAPIFEQVIEKWPGSIAAARANRQLVDIYTAVKKTDKVAACLKALATGDYSDVDDLHSWGVRGYLVCLITDGKLRDGFDIIQKRWKGDAVYLFAVWGTQAFSYVDDEKKKNLAPAAAAAFEAVAAANPADPHAIDAEIDAARVLGMAKLGTEAQAKFNALIKKHPDSDGVRWAYGSYLVGLGKFNEGRESYRNMKDTWQGDSLIVQSYDDERNLNSAIEQLKRMLDKYPNQAKNIQWQLGEYLARTGKYKEAIAAYQASQNEPESLFRVAGCQTALTQYDAAIETLTGVMNFFKADAPRALWEIAQVQAAKGDSKTTILTLRRLCKNYLNSPWAGRAHQELSQKYGVQITLGGSANRDQD